MDGNDFIALAGKLAAAPHADEATFRTSVSRAYYGAFHVARSFLVELGFVPVANANVHAFVRHYLHASKNVNASVAAGVLDDLQRARNRADYDLNDPTIGERNFAMLIVEMAHRIVSGIDKCRDPLTQFNMHAAIVEYEHKIRGGRDS